MPGFGLGIGFRNPRPRLKSAFSPLSLSPTAWYDPSDLTTLFQDSAGTTPVTASGQPVGKMLDKSGNGNHLTQATAGLRPIYTVSGGLSFLAFDGVDDILVSAGNIVPITGDTSFAFAYARLAGGTLNKYLTTNNVGVNGSLGVLHSANAPRWFSPRTGTGGDITSSTSTADGQKAVLRAKADRTNLLHTLYLNGASVGTAGVSNSDFTDATLGIGGNAASGYAAMQYHGGLYVARVLTAPEAAKVDTYLGAKAGLVL